MADDERPPLSSFEARPPLSSFEAQTETPPAPSFGEKLAQTWPVRLLKPAVTGAALPGQVAQGSLDVAPSTPGMWSDEDEARLQLTNAEITKRAVEAAPFASPTPAAMRGAGAEGIFGVPTTGPIAPSLGQLKQAAVAGYEYPTVQGVKLDAGAGPALADQIYAAFNQPGVDIHKALVPRTSAVLDDLYKIPAPKAGEPDPFLTVANLRTVYRQLGKAAASPDATERLAAKSAQQHIHEFLANMPEGYVIKGDPKAAGEIIQEANTNYAGMKRAEDLDLRLTRAYVRAAGANSGMNVGNTIRQRMADVVANPNLARRIPADELAMMKGIAEGNSGTNLMRYVSNFLGGGGGALSAIWSLSGHHLLPVAGYALRRLYNSNVGRAADVLQGAIRQRTPLGQQMLHEPVEPGLLGARTVPKLGPAVGPSVGAPGLPAVYGHEQQDNDKGPPGQQKGGRINAQQQDFAAGGAAPGLRDGEVHPIDTITEDEPPIEGDASKPDVIVEKPVRKASGGSIGKIIRKYDVPYLAGSSNDDQVVYIDRRVPLKIAVRRATGKGYASIDPSEFLAAHERAEHEAMRKGKSYEKAHVEDGTAAEREMVEKHGLDWKSYEGRMDELLSHIEHEKVRFAPPDLYVKPYPHKEQLLLKNHESRST